MALILIVDGQRPFRDYLASLLISRQDTVLEANDGAEALEMIRKNLPDLVICDVFLQVMDGYAFVEEMRRLIATSCPAVIFCVSPCFEKEARIAAPGCNVRYVIAKTAAPHFIIETVYASLGKLLPTGYMPAMGLARLRAAPRIEPIDPNATVHIVDDHPAMRRLLSTVITSSGLNVATFASAEEFLDVYEDEPGCLLTDLRMTGMSGIEMLSALRACQKRIPAIVVTALDELADARLAMKLEVREFLDKKVPHKRLLARIYAALQEDAEQRRSYREVKQCQGRLSSLTAREWELGELLVDGKPSKVIAVSLNISIKTVAIHRTHLMSKTGASNVADLVRIMMIARGE